MMRIDRFLTSCGICSRSEAVKSAKAGGVTVNGKTVKDTSVHIDPDADTVTFFGKTVAYSKFTYIMMNKPSGYVCATEDTGPIVTDLLPGEEKRKGLFPCGRLDKNTFGFVLLTNNGALAHRLLSPKHHAEKIYYFTLLSPLSEKDRTTLEGGVTIISRDQSSADKTYNTLPCKIDMKDDVNGVITLTEGKFHQIKRMAEFVGNKIVFLKRISFGGVMLDETLDVGQWRFLTDDEIGVLERNG